MPAATIAWLVASSSARGRAIGYVQYYPLTEEEGRSYDVPSIEGVYGMDLLVGQPDLWGRGMGTRVVSMVLGYLFQRLDARRVAIDPVVTNHRAIRCYEKAGFRRVKVLPRHELHEGEYRDCWLMVAEPMQSSG